MTGAPSLDRLLRWRWPIIFALTAIAAFLARYDDPPDLLQFAQRGGVLLGGHFSSVYAGSWNQAGPLQLVIARGLMIGSSTDRPVFAVELAVALGLMALVFVVSRRSGASAVGQFLIALVAVIWLGPAGLWSGHPIEVLIPGLWLAGAVAVAQGRWLACGLLLGVAVMIAPWAILAVPVAFVGPVGALRAITVAVATTLAGYLPFALSGRFDMFSNVWVVSSHSLVHYLDPGLVHFSWELRLVQAAAAAGGCFVIARWRRGAVDAYWAAPLAAVLLRILLDPVLLSYYWLPAGALVVGGAAIGGAVSRRTALVLAVLAWLTYFGASDLLPVVSAFAALAVLIYLLAAARPAAGRRLRTQTPLAHSGIGG